MHQNEPERAYPQHWEADVVGRDGSLIQIRPIRPSDRGALQEFHMGQSERSRYFRFFAPLPQLSERDLDRFTQVDYRDRVALVAIAGDRILGVGRYDRIDASTAAEVAFNVSDMEQGRGLGSVLLEHLAAAARERGLTQFTADVLPANVKMLRVFRDAGYSISQEIDDDVMTVSFDIDPTMRQLEVLAEREHRSESRAMRSLFIPEGVVAIFSGLEGERYEGLFRDQLPADVPIFRSVAAFEELVVGDDAPGSGLHAELAVIAADPPEVLQLLPLLQKCGVGMVVLLSDGFSEVTPDSSEATFTQQQLRRQLRRHHLRLVGPRSYGVLIQKDTKALNLLADRAWQTELTNGDGASAGIGVFAQSAAGTRGILSQLIQAGAPIHSVISAGHRLDISGNDVMQFLATDENVSVVAMAFESIGNPRKFNRIARRLSAQVPVVATLFGESGQVLPTSQPDTQRPSRRAVLEQLMKQAGVFLAETTAQQVEWSLVLGTGRIPAGSKIQVLTNSRTQGALAAELADGGQLSSLVLSPVASEEEFLGALAHTFADQSWHVLVIAYGRFGDDYSQTIYGRIAELLEADPRLVIITDDAATKLSDTGLVHIAGLGPSIRAAQIAIQYGTGDQHEDEYPLPQGMQRGVARGIIDDYLATLPRQVRREPIQAPPEVARAVLNAYGLFPLQTIRVTSAREAIAAAQEVGWPVALKSADPAVRHRLDVGGVILSIDDAEEMVEAWNDLHHQLGQIGRTEVACDVQPMAAPGVACVITGEEDDRYGPIISFGLAGDASDLLADVSYRVPPLRNRDVSGLIYGVKAAERLRGYQGLPEADVGALAQVIARLSLLKEDLAQVLRVELHPLLVATQGATILEAHMVLQVSTRGDLVRRSLPT